MSQFCKGCEYRRFLAKVFDIHIDNHDCDRVDSCFCEKMRKPDHCGAKTDFESEGTVE